VSNKDFGRGGHTEEMECFHAAQIRQQTPESSFSQLCCGPDLNSNQLIFYTLNFISIPVGPQNLVGLNRAKSKQGLVQFLLIREIARHKSSSFIKSGSLAN
jgi:hypothetical protein